MPLISCPTCGGKLSTNAKACPHCGEPNFERPSIKVSEDMVGENVVVKRKDGVPDEFILQAISSSGLRICIIRETDYGNRGRWYSLEDIDFIELV